MWLHWHRPAAVLERTRRCAEEAGRMYYLCGMRQADRSENDMINYGALCFGFAFVIGFIFLLAWIGMSGGPRHTVGLPPDYPPGYKDHD